VRIERAHQRLDHARRHQTRKLAAFALARSHTVGQAQVLLEQPQDRMAGTLLVQLAAASIEIQRGIGAVAGRKRL
jgi:hypothetical protein